MKKALSLLNDLRVATPCHVDWDQMQGTDQVRHCNQCNLKVYNLSQMTETEATALVMAEEGRLCVRFYRRTDGTMLTRDCPKGFAARAWHLARALTLAALSLVGWLFALGCDQKEKCYQGDVVRPDQSGHLKESAPQNKP